MIGLFTSQDKETDFDGQSLPASNNHAPVMIKEVVKYMRPQAEGVYVDGTVGMGGHAKAILNRIGYHGRLIAVDRDSQSLNQAKENLSEYHRQCEFINDDYRNLDQILKQADIQEVDGILLDLGISSFQLDNPQRGFSLREDGPLDMRMDQNARICAFDLINSLSEKEISSILKNYGQERWHHRIAKYVVHQRSIKPIASTKDLSLLVMKAIPRRRNRERIHPATRTFQAFRIAVNRELESLEMALNKCIERVKVGGRIGIISFHSLEDRIVKLKFRDGHRAGKLKLILKKPLRPTDEEVQENARARSARLRVAERI